MKKRFVLFKTFQLLLLILITAGGLAAIFSDGALYQMVGRDPSVRALCILLWLTLALSFAGVFWDLSTHNSMKRDYGELDYAVYNDRVAGIANRYSCDAMIEKYLDRPLPEDTGCIMLELMNIRDVNEKFGRQRGNELIQSFASILHAASLGLCFVGRNGGNKFMALFESCEDVQVNDFLERIRRQVEAENAQASAPRIEYRTGCALNRIERAQSVTQLISLADRRLQGAPTPSIQERGE